jgi:hypothetical protein
MSGDHRRRLTLPALFLIVAGCGDSTGPDDSGAIASGVIFATSQPSSRLYRVPVHPDSSDVEIGPVLTPAGANLFITDIAVAPNGRLWGVTFNELYRINATTAAATLVGSLGQADINAITFAPDGRLLGAGASGTFVVIDTISGRATASGSYGGSLISAGDLAFGPNGTLYATMVGFAAGDLLATINLANGTATLITTTPNGIGFGAVWGLDFVEGQLYGLTAFSATGAPGDLIRINTTNGAGTRVRSTSFSAAGATRPSNPGLR